MSRRRVALLAVAAVLVVLFGGRWLALRYTDAIWFADLGQGARYRALLLRSLGWQAAIFAAALAWFAAHTVGVYASIGAVHLPRRLGNLEIDEAVPSRILRAVALGTAALLALATAYTFGDLDQYVALARAAAPFGRTDPFLGRDAAFYLAVLPLLEVLHLLAAVLAVLAALLVIGLYAVTGSLAVTGRRVRITPHARTHLVILLAALALVVAWGFQIDAYQTIAGGGHLNGALNATDRTIRIPASHALAAFSLAVAVGSVLALRWVRPMPLFIMWSLLGVATVLGRLVIPVSAEAWGASDDQETAVQIARFTDNYSREGFGLHATPVRLIPSAEVRPESAAALTQALDGLYAWSGQPELPGRMLDDIARDTTNLRLWSVSAALARDASGRLRPAAIAVAQTDFAHAERVMPRPRWTPLHRGPLAWGGEPVAISGALRAGSPEFLARLDPADTAPPGTPLRAGAPRVRFLPHAAELGIVGPDEGTATDPAPGILLSNMLRRLLLGWALQSPPLLDEHTSNADRVLYWRDIPTRLARLYPFAGFDPARAAIVDGRLTWIVDGYLMSQRFPLAEPIRWRGDLVNFLSSPYVVTVDAGSGATAFYMRPGANAFEASVARSARLSPLPAESLPDGVRRALHYPEGLLGGQAAMLARRSERDERGQPWTLLWGDTSESAHDAALQRPTVAIAAPDGGAPRVWQFIPLLDSRVSHLAALAAGTTSAAGALELVELRLEGNDVATPHAAGARMAAAPEWVAASAALGTTDNAIHRGPVLAVPAAGTVVYAQLLFSTGRLNEPIHIEGVGALAGSRVGFGTDTREAARSLVRGEGAPAVHVIGAADLAQARAAFLALDSARQAGNWEKFGQAWTNLRRALHLDPAPPPPNSRIPRTGSGSRP